MTIAVIWLTSFILVAKFMNGKEKLRVMDVIWLIQQGVASSSGVFVQVVSIIRSVDTVETIHTLLKVDDMMESHKPFSLPWPFYIGILSTMLAIAFCSFFAYSDTNLQICVLLLCFIMLFNGVTELQYVQICYEIQQRFSLLKRRLSLCLHSLSHNIDSSKSSPVHSGDNLHCSPTGNTKKNGVLNSLEVRNSDMSDASEQQNECYLEDLSAKSSRDDHNTHVSVINVKSRNTSICTECLSTVDMSGEVTKVNSRKNLLTRRSLENDQKSEIAVVSLKNSTNRDRELSDELEHIRRIYDTLCNAMDSVNTGFGIPILLLVLFFFCDITIDVFFLILYALHSSRYLEDKHGHFIDDFFTTSEVEFLRLLLNIVFAFIMLIILIHFSEAVIAEVCSFLFLHKSLYILNIKIDA